VTPSLATETCDGKDNDCNGLTDDAAPGDKLCDDGNPCTDDSCSPSACVFAPNAGPCDDGSACTVGDVCVDSKCTAKPVACDDGNVCTDDTCDPQQGCAHANNAASCDDGVACTAGDKCSGGKCLPTTSCPCKTIADCVQAEDGDPCNGTLYCDFANPPFVCKVNPKTIIVCDPTKDTNCLSAQCQPNTGECLLVPPEKGTPCDDGSDCTYDDGCLNGLCAGKPIDCNDSNLCTSDYCTAGKICVHAANSSPCFVDGPCTDGGYCEASVCKLKQKSCDDDYACTLDSCDAATGCVHVASQNLECGVVPLPYQTSFTCGNVDVTYWHLSGTDAPTGAVRWKVSGIPSPGYASPPCSLNANNGYSLTCKGGQAGISATADSPWFDATKLPKVQIDLTFSTVGYWGAGDTAAVLIRFPGTSWLEIGVIQPSPWTWKSIKLASSDWSGKKFQLRFAFKGACGLPFETGWFVDDLEVTVDPCGFANGGCPAGTACTVGALGGAVCLACQAGFTFDGKKCVDVDECALPDTCGANTTCTNTSGAFQCACKLGYSGDGVKCSDIDECATLGVCGQNATCTNTPGAFLCSCPLGFLFDGGTCAKVGTKSNPGASCLAILKTFPGSPDGSYWLDFDGPGAAVSPVAYVCDMKGGGWTRLMSDDFEDLSQSNWSSGPATTCGGFGAILGGAGVFGSAAWTWKDVYAPPHGLYKLEATYLFIDAWKNEWANISVNEAIVWTNTHAGAVSNCQNACGSPSVCDAEAKVSLIRSHSTTSVSIMTVSAASSLAVAPNIAAFGIDNVHLWVK